MSTFPPPLIITGALSACRVRNGRVYPHPALCAQPELRAEPAAVPGGRVALQR